MGGHICISKEKVKVCGGQSFASSPDMMKTKTVQYACVGAPSSKATSMEQRAKAGESLGIELGVLSTAYTKEVAEPKFCATGATGGMGGGYGSELYSELSMGGNDGFGPNGGQVGNGMRGGSGMGGGSGFGGGSGIGGGSGNGYSHGSGSGSSYGGSW